MTAPLVEQVTMAVVQTTPHLPLDLTWRDAVTVALLSSDAAPITTRMPLALIKKGARTSTLGPEKAKNQVRTRLSALVLNLDAARTTDGGFGT